MRVSLPKKTYFVLFALFVFCGFTDHAFAQFAEKLTARKKGLSLVETKISSNIRETVKKLSTASAGNLSKMADDFSNARLKIDQAGYIQSYIYFSDAPPNYLATLKQLRIRIEIVNADFGMLQAWVPFAKFDELAALNFVNSVTLPDFAVKMTGSVNSEGDAVLRANEVRNNLGFDGAGVRVGIISDGVDSRSQAQATQDLPAQLTVSQSFPGQGDEGTAMLEIVHDLAPAAQLAFAGPRTSLEMAGSIRFLADTVFAGSGCQIVVDDLGFVAEPAFQDGLLAQTVNAVAATGTTYLTAAGNIAEEHYEQIYSPGTMVFQQQLINVHDFGAAAGGQSDVTMRVVVADGGELTVVMHWNDPSPGSGNDYDLALLHAGVDTILAAGADFQTGTQRPLEVAVFENESGGDISVDLIIVNSDAQPRMLELVMIGGGFAVEQHNISDGSIAPGHQAASGAITVGAIFVLDSGVNTIESFSSRGPARIFFPQIEERAKPDIASVDGGVITGAGGFGQEFPGGSGNIRFFGTSAAAPHAAGVAALVLSANPNLTPNQVRNALTGAAVDLGTPGSDHTFGAGRIDAFAAVQLVTSVEGGDDNVPTGFSLGQNYPNPFNPSTVIRYSLPTSGRVTLDIFNVLGQKIRSLVNNLQTTGSHNVEWNGRDGAGKLVDSGVYLYRLQVGSFVETKKMVLMQ
jgi:subtilisin family serine protease